jgi:hypothetical protein
VIDEVEKLEFARDPTEKPVPTFPHPGPASRKLMTIQPIARKSWLPAEIAHLMSRVKVKRETPEQIRPDVIAVRRYYQTLSYIR